MSRRRDAVRLAITHEAGRGLTNMMLDDLLAGRQVEAMRRGLWPDDDRDWWSQAWQFRLHRDGAPADQRRG